MQCDRCRVELPPQAQFCSACGGVVARSATGPTLPLTPAEQPDGQRPFARGHCPNCQSTDIVVQANALRPKQHPPVALVVSGTIWRGFQYTDLTTCVCVSCGYVEQYVTDAGALRQIADTWDRP